MSTTVPPFAYGEGALAFNLMPEFIAQLPAMIGRSGDFFAECLANHPQIEQGARSHALAPTGLFRQSNHEWTLHDQPRIGEGNLKQRQDNRTSL